MNEKFIESWINIDTSVSKIDRIIIFDSTKAIVTTKFKSYNNLHTITSYISSPNLFSNNKSGFKIKLDNDQKHIYISIFDFSGAIRDTLIGICKYRGSDTLLISWSNNWDNRKVLIFKKENKLPEEQIRELTNIFSFINDLYSNFKKHVSPYIEEDSNSLVMGGDISTSNILYHSKYNYVANNLNVNLIVIGK